MSSQDRAIDVKQVEATRDSDPPTDGSCLRCVQESNWPTSDP